MSAVNIGVSCTAQLTTHPVNQLLKFLVYEGLKSLKAS